MQNITCERALEIIKDMGISEVIEYEALFSNIEDGEEHLQCYENAEQLVIIDHCEDDNCEYVTVIPYRQSFEIAELTDLISEHCTNPIVSLNSHRLSEDFIHEFAKGIRELVGCETKQYLDYAFSDTAAPSGFSSGIRMMEESDREACVERFTEEMRYRPPFSLLFDLFVTKKVGFIIGAFDGNEPVGYLAFTEITPDVYDVDFVYVLPEKRAKGWGRKLADAYTYYANANKHTAYWSSAANEASVKTATASGFKLVRVVKKFSKS